MALEQIDQHITQLNQALELHEQKYAENIEILDNKLIKISNQLDRTNSPIRREILMKQIDYYEDQTQRMDHAIQTIRQDINNQIVKMEQLKKSEEDKKKKEKNSLEYNIEHIRKCCKNRSATSLFEALESVANALEIIRDAHQ